MRRTVIVVKYVNSDKELPTYNSYTNGAREVHISPCLISPAVKMHLNKIA